MNYDGIYTVKFLIGLVIVICVFTLSAGLWLTNKIEDRVEKNKALLKELQQNDYQDVERAESILRQIVVSGGRG